MGLKQIDIQATTNIQFITDKLQELPNIGIVTAAIIDFSENNAKSIIKASLQP
ncbi:hypothetical protein RAC47_04385 (plasmid) [Borreliella carolinensis]|nr:hypothetical protein [Borreliella carolinensis]WNY63318.1 hypothetical protein RAC47_04385 [Borreliella carolinensis]